MLHLGRMASDPDALLVSRARAGDATARRDLVERYRQRIAGFASLMISGIDDPEDIAQEALSTAIQKLGEFRGDSRFSSWIFGIALNLCRNRRRAKREQSASDEQLEAAAIRRRSVLSSLVRRESVQKVMEAVEALPEDLREAFVLRHLENLEYSEIASISGAAEGAIRVRAHRARLMLQSVLGPHFENLLPKSGESPSK